MKSNPRLELRRNLELANWIFDVIDNWSEPEENESSLHSFSITMLSKVHQLTTALQESEYLVAQAMLARSLIECVADITAIYHSMDRESTAKEYQLYSYNSYAAIHTELTKIIQTGNFSKTKLRKRIFDKRGASWADKNLMQRISDIDKNSEAINKYDILSHYTHLGGSGAAQFLDSMVEQMVHSTANYQIVFIVIMLAEFGIFTKEEILHFTRLTQGMMLEVIKHGNFKTPPTISMREM